MQDQLDHMNRSINALVFLLLAAAALAVVAIFGPSCSALSPTPKGMIHVSAIAPLIERVNTRHDALVEAHVQDPLEKEIALASTQALRDVILEAQGVPSLPPPAEGGGQ